MDVVELCPAALIYLRVLPQRKPAYSKFHPITLKDLPVSIEMAENVGQFLRVNFNYCPHGGGDGGGGTFSCTCIYMKPYAPISTNPFSKAGCTAHALAFPQGCHLLW
jgi:hypothetical protein